MSSPDSNMLTFYPLLAIKALANTICKQVDKNQYGTNIVLELKSLAAKSHSKTGNLKTLTRLAEKIGIFLHIG
jgi:hypothetical protein